VRKFLYVAKNLEVNCNVPSALETTESDGEIFIFTYSLQPTVSFSLNVIINILDYKFSFDNLAPEELFNFFIDYSSNGF